MSQAQTARIVLRWKAVPGSSAYELQIARDPGFVEVVLQTQTTTAGHRWDELPIVAHWYRVRSIDSEGRWSEWSTAQTISVDAVIPANPALKRPHDGATAICGRSLQLEVETAALVKEYGVELSQSKGFEQPMVLLSPTPVFAVEALAPGAWWWRSFAVDLKGRRTGPGPARTFWVRVGAPKLRPIADVVFGTPQVTFSWEAMSCAERWAIEIMHDGKGRVSMRSPQSSQIFRPAEAGEYRWKVAGVDASGGLGAWSPETSFHVRLRRPELNGSELSGRGAILSWGAVAGARLYSLELFAGSVSGPKVAQAQVGDLTWRTPDLDVGAYVWRVTAIDGAGHESQASQAHTFERIALPEPAPVENAQQRVVATPTVAPDFRRSNELNFAPFGGLGRFSVGFFAGGIFDFAAVSSPNASLGALWRLPVWERRLAAELRGGVFAASARSARDQRALQGSALLVPLSLMLGWHQPLGAYVARGALGPALQLAWLTVDHVQSTEVTPGLELVVGLGGRVGAGRVEVEAGLFYARIDRTTVRLNAGGLMVRLGYAFELGGAR